jgi:hypothetical protein
MLRLAAATPRTAAAWTGTGASHERRGLKHRPDGAIRMVPVPPVLVAMLRAHHAAYGTASDGRLFRGTRGGPLSESVYGRAWHAARALALSAPISPPAGSRSCSPSTPTASTATTTCSTSRSDTFSDHPKDVVRAPSVRKPAVSTDRATALKLAVCPTARRARTPSAMRP